MEELNIASRDTCFNCHFVGIPCILSCRAQIAETFAALCLAKLVIVVLVEDPGLLHYEVVSLWRLNDVDFLFAVSHLIVFQIIN